MITSINNNSLESITAFPRDNKSVRSEEQTSKFADILKASIENVNQTQVKSSQKTEALAMGEIDNLHDVMIAAQKASITLEATVQVQRKVIDAYNEIMRMQV